MTDQLLGFALLGVAVVGIGVVVSLAGRGKERGPLHPPPGVHVPPGSWLPISWATGGALLAAGLAFKPEDQAVAWWFFLPGLACIVLAAILSVRVAGREWRDTEHGSHDEGASHH
jgi:hypothetical protein